MFKRDAKTILVLEIFLLLICAALSCVLYRILSSKMIVLNLYYLPVLLAAIFLGRYRAGILAIFCVVSALIVMVWQMPQFALHESPLTIALSVTLWGAVLGLTTLMVGTLSDERVNRIDELHDAYLGIVEVLSTYLNAAGPQAQCRPSRVAELCRQVATTMKLSADEIDDVRVAALLREIENVEVTARVISRAIGDLDDHGRPSDAPRTFHGTDLVQSLSEVLTRALPLLVEQDSLGQPPVQGRSLTMQTPFGGRIVDTVRCFDSLVFGSPGQERLSPQQAIDELRSGLHGEHHPAVLEALARVASQEIVAANEQFVTNGEFVAI